MFKFLALMISLSVVACGGDDSSGSAGAAGAGAGSSGSAGSGGSAAGGSSGAGGSAGASGATNTGGGANTGGATNTGGGSGAGSSPKAQYVPKPGGKCPEFTGAEITLQPAQGARTVKLWISDAAKTLEGPLVFYWHGWHGSPGAGGISSAARTQLLAMGGMLVAPYIDAADEDEYWDMDDVLMADEVVACAIEKVGIDLRRIYSTGLSAGGWQTLHFAYKRSGYVAAAVAYSAGTNGGLSAVPQDPTGKFAALLSHGGSSEPAIYQTLAEGYFDGLTKNGHFVAMCQHTNGHSAPAAMRDVAFDFLMAHPFGTTPSPFAGGLPAAFPAYCGLTK
ncbi:MAG TPA: hypothetical protein PKA88_11455 [Polyangiaceae bacterium]|nr:hypothetical protein [Polyangiaceae bacterium]